MDSKTAHKLVQQHGSVRQAAMAAGMPRSTFRDIIEPSRKNRHKQYGTHSKATKKTPKQTACAVVPTRSLADFKKSYDRNTIVPARIRDGIAKIAEAKTYLYEHEFVRLAQIQYTDLATFREMFEAFQVSVDKGRKVIWCGTKSQAAEFRKVVA